MLLIFLIFLLISILIIAYYLFHKELCSPSILFVVPFILMCVIALFNTNLWSFELHINTFAVILFGTTSFCLGAFIGDKVKLKDLGYNCNIIDEQEVGIWKYVSLLAVQIVCYVIKLRYIMNYAMSHGVTRNLSQCLEYYNNIQKFTTDETVNFPGWLSTGCDLCAVFGFICACMLAQQILSKRKNWKQIFWIFLNFVVAALGGMTSGGRGGTVQILIAFLCVYIILYQRKYDWEKKIPLKNIFYVGIGLMLIGVFFLISTTWVGRTAAQNTVRYLSNYIGAQIYNLDYFLNNAFSRSQIWGQETFYPLIEKIAGWIGNPDWSNYHAGASSVYAAGYSTGNVYTTFYPYIKDFGAVGVIIIPIIFGLISQIVYRYARRSPNENAINMGLIIYSIFAYSIAFSFFADKFGSLLITFNMFKRLILLVCLYVFLFKVDIQKNAIILRIDTIRFMGLRISL